MCEWRLSPTGPGLLPNNIASRSCIQQDTFYVQVEKYDLQIIAGGKWPVVKNFETYLRCICSVILSNFKLREWSSDNAC